MSLKTKTKKKTSFPHSFGVTKKKDYSLIIHPMTDYSFQNERVVMITLPKLTSVNSLCNVEYLVPVTLLCPSSNVIAIQQTHLTNAISSLTLALMHVPLIY